MPKSIRLTRKELFEVVWAEPISRIAKRLDASDVAIAKICKKLDVPRPPRGYWARVQHGYAVHQPRLPKLKGDTPSEWTLTPQGSRSSWKTSSEETLQIAVPEKLGRPHRDLVKVRASLKSARKDEYGRVCSSKKLVHVTPQSVSRCIRLLTTLLRTLEQRGHSITQEEAGLSIWAEGEQFRIAIYEPTKRIPHPNPSGYGYPKWDYVATGRLSLTLNAPGFYRIRRQWSDTARKSLEDKLGEVVLAIESAPDAISAERRARAHRELQEAREALVRRRMIDRVRLTHERAETIEKLHADWQRAAEIRALMAAINDEEYAPAASKRLARWGVIFADHLDPLKSFRIGALDEEPNRYSW